MPIFGRSHLRACSIFHECLDGGRVHMSWAFQRCLTCHVWMTKEPSSPADINSKLCNISTREKTCLVMLTWHRNESKTSRSTVHDVRKPWFQTWLDSAKYAPRYSTSKTGCRGRVVFVTLLATSTVRQACSRCPIMRPAGPLMICAQLGASRGWQARVQG